MVLPGSPNRGMFGGDGAYGEAKSALDAVVSRWHAESSWAARVSLAHALIGWTRGTGLMGHNDAIVAAVEEAGVTTYSTDEMAGMLLGPVRRGVQSGRGRSRRSRPTSPVVSARPTSTWPSWPPRPARRCRPRRAAD